MVTPPEDFSPELLGVFDALSVHPAVRPLALLLGPDRPGARDLVARMLAEDWEVVLAGAGASALLERHALAVAAGRLRCVPFDGAARLPALLAELEPDRCVDLRPLSPREH